MNLVFPKEIIITKSRKSKSHYINLVHLMWTYLRIANEGENCESTHGEAQSQPITGAWPVSNPRSGVSHLVVPSIPRSFHWIPVSKFPSRAQPWWRACWEEAPTPRNQETWAIQCSPHLHLPGTFIMWLLTWPMRSSEAGEWAQAWTHFVYLQIKVQKINMGVEFKSTITASSKEIYTPGSPDT